MSRGPSIPGPLSHPIVDLFAWVIGTVLVLAIACKLIGCTGTAPDCEPVPSWSAP